MITLRDLTLMSGAPVSKKIPKFKTKSFLEMLNDIITEHPNIYDIIH